MRKIIMNGHEMKSTPAKNHRIAPRIPPSVSRTSANTEINNMVIGRIHIRWPIIRGMVIRDQDG